jgi:hypothetical protein
MKRTELRIGNWIDWNGELGVISQLLELEVAFKCGESDLYKSLKPIPLTEEWLLKFGFKKDTKYDWELKVNGVLFYGMCDDSQPINTGIGILNLPNSIINIKHVHQLQNLYFALTGEELTIKNKTL